jgi:hypothetical protein
MFFAMHHLVLSARLVSLLPLVTAPEPIPSPVAPFESAGPENPWLAPESRAAPPVLCIFPLQAVNSKVVQAIQNIFFIPV